MQYQNFMKGVIMGDKSVPPSAEELDRLRKDASEGDINAANFFRNNDDKIAADSALAEWRRSQVTSSDK